MNRSSADGSGRLLCQTRGKRARLGIQLLKRYDPVGDAPSERGTGIDRFSEREHLERPHVADAHRHQQAGRGFRHQRQTDERCREQRVLGEHHEVAMQQHGGADADGAALHGGHQRPA